MAMRSAESLQIEMNIVRRTPVCAMNVGILALWQFGVEHFVGRVDALLDRCPPACWPWRRLQSKKKSCIALIRSSEKGERESEWFRGEKVHNLQ